MKTFTQLVGTTATTSPTTYGDAFTIKKKTGRPVGYKHTSETRKKMSNTRKGYPGYGKGKTYEEMYGDKAEKVRQMRKESSKGNQSNAGKHFSIEHRRKISNSHKGEKSYMWKGGGSVQNQIRGLFEYRLWRSDIYRRDDFTCQMCKVKGGRLHPHHIKPFSIILTENHITTVEQALKCDELWNINNGQTLCVDCHKQADTWANKARNYYKTLTKILQ